MNGNIEAACVKEDVIFRRDSRSSRLRFELANKTANELVSTVQYWTIFESLLDSTSSNKSGLADIV
jgi:hypothetical protein